MMNNRFFSKPQFLEIILYVCYNSCLMVERSEPKGNSSDHYLREIHVKGLRAWDYKEDPEGPTVRYTNTLRNLRDLREVLAYRDLADFPNFFGALSRDTQEVVIADCRRHEELMRALRQERGNDFRDDNWVPVQLTTSRNRPDQIQFITFMADVTDSEIVTYLDKISSDLMEEKVYITVGWKGNATSHYFISATRELRLREKKKEFEGINELGLLVHGIGTGDENDLIKILREGIKPRNEQADPTKPPSEVPDHVLLSMVGDRGYEETTTAFLRGASRTRPNSISVVIDPNYVREHSGDFIAVGDFFSPLHPQWKVFFEGKFPYNIQYQQVKAEVYGDEVITKFIPPAAIIAVIANESHFERIKAAFFGAHFRNKNLFLYTPVGTRCDWIDS